MTLPQPTVLGLRRSFGFGDRLGLATPGHLAALAGSGFAGIFAQQSIREMTRTQRTAPEVMRAAQTALAEAGYADEWGADADHLKTPDDVDVTTAAGFTFFTIDPSDFVNNAADTMAEDGLRREASAQQAEAVFGGEDPVALYDGKTYALESGEVTFATEPLLRAIAKYGRALGHIEKMARHIATANAGRLYEIEVSVDETETPTTPLEHLFIALELRRRGVVIVSLAPRFIGDFEKGIDYRGDLAAFEVALKQHMAIARAYGPYKLSIHSGSDKFSVYPAIGRVCGELLHVKTAGTSYLEALRVVAKADAPLFAEIVQYAGGRFAEDKKSYHISVTDNDIPGLLGASDLERVFLDEDHGRQVLHVTFGSVLTVGKGASGRLFKDAVLETLVQNPDLHAEFLARHLGKHLSLLNAG